MTLCGNKTLSSLPSLQQFPCTFIHVVLTKSFFQQADRLFLHAHHHMFCNMGIQRIFCPLIPSPSIHPRSRLQRLGALRVKDRTKGRGAGHFTSGSWRGSHSRRLFLWSQRRSLQFQSPCNPRHCCSFRLWVLRLHCLHPSTFRKSEAG